MSNILDLFKQDKQVGGTQEDCLGCLAMSSGVMTIGGAYLFSGAVFYNKGKALPNVSSTYKMSVRTLGVPVFLFGLFRGYQAWELYKKDGAKWY